MKAGEVLWDSVPAGIVSESEEGFHFSYYEQYIHSNYPPISLSLPKRTEPYTAITLFSFFDGLIPEGWLLDIAQKTWKIDSRDRMELLLTCCENTIGAVHVRRIHDA